MEALSDIADAFIPLGINIQRLEELASDEDLKPFIAILTEFARNPNKEVLKAFSEAYNEKFGISIKKNDTSFVSFDDVEEYVFENWNYDPSTRKIISNNYSMSMWTKTPTGALDKLFTNSKEVVMGRGTSFNSHGDYEITITNNNK